MYCPAIVSQSFYLLNAHSSPKPFSIESFMNDPPTNDKKFIYFIFHSKTCCWIRFQVENMKMIVKKSCEIEIWNFFTTRLHLKEPSKYNLELRCLFLMKHSCECFFFIGTKLYEPIVNR